jgi:hypothetical protein
MAPPIIKRARRVLSNKCASPDEMGKGRRALKYYIVVKNTNQENFIRYEE